MSFESFRSDLIARLVSASWDNAQICAFLEILDPMADRYEIMPITTALIETGGIPDAVRLYIASKSVRNLARGSLKNYYSALSHFFAAVRKQVDDVTTNDVRLYLHQYKTQRKIMDSTLETIRIQLNGFFEWCVEEELIRKNPVRRIEAIRLPDPERLPLSALELETVRNHCRTLREKAVVDFLFSTAARVSEFCALKISDVNFADHTVRIEHGKGDKGRTTYLNAEAEISLRAYLAGRNDHSDALFATSRGTARHLCVKTVQNEIQRIVSRCGLTVHVTPHIFRHTAASLALQRGMPINQVQRFLGHAKIQTTLRYAKLLDYEVKESHRKFVA